ncbi:hypothetical protein [Rhodopirellula islandica]|nr:hypothetical protein [Rhodopirellula islandica]
MNRIRGLPRHVLFCSSLLTIAEKHVVRIDHERGNFGSCFAFRVSNRPISTYRLRLSPLKEGTRHGDLEYDAAARSTLDHAFVLRAIGEITGELAVDEQHAVKGTVGIGLG